MEKRIFGVAITETRRRIVAVEAMDEENGGKEDMRYYLAYGSNLSLEQMAERCPDAEVQGMAVLVDWRLAFHQHATIEPSKGGAVPVLVWSISEKDEERLDRYEGFPRYYYKEEMDVVLLDFQGRAQGHIKAMVYIMAEGRQGGRPSPFYVDILREGYDRFGFNQALIDKALEEVR